MTVFTACPACEGKGQIENKRICDNCSKEGEMRLDPYYEEVNDLMLITCLCDDCYSDSVQDI